MEQTRVGELVQVTPETGPALAGIVFDTPSTTKVVVAVVDRGRGPGFRTVHPRTLSERAEASPDDRALRLLIKRTPTPKRAGGRGGSGSQRSGAAGHSRGAAHRATGK